MASTNRTHYYAKGLQGQGHEVKVIVPIPLENKGYAKNCKAQGVHEGITFTYANRTTERSNSFLGRRWQDMIGPIKTACYILKEKTDVVLLISTDPYQIALFKIATYWSKALFIQEKNEFPFVFTKQRGVARRLYQKIYNYLIPKCFDGMLVISAQLHTFLKSRIKKNAQLLLVPIIVDVEEFSRNTTVSSENYIAYAGNLSNFKDGVDTLIKAFYQVVQQVPDIRLYLIGSSSENNKKRVDHLLDKYQLHNKVLLTGYISREKLVEYMQNARALALAKPNSIQANFCFPSKLGEYLATGNPVVTTQVGEIPYYLEDGKSAFLSNPDDTSEFAKKLLLALSDPKSANHVGQAGREVAQEKFSYKVQGKRISDFFYQLSYQKQKA